MPVTTRIDAEDDSDDDNHNGTAAYKDDYNEDSVMKRHYSNMAAEFADIDHSSSFGQSPTPTKKWHLQHRMSTMMKKWKNSSRKSLNENENENENEKKSLTLDN